MRVPGQVQLGSIEIFCKAAELGSFTATASFFGLTPASVSRSISRMETRLGTRLFARTTRTIRLTNEGYVYWQQCRQALDQIFEAEQSITGNQRIPAGRLRISVGTPYARHRLLPMLPRLRERYPQLELELDITNRIVDFVEEGFDLTIRLGIPKDSRLIAHHLEDATLGIFASPEYLARHGEPQTPDDLDRHECIQYVLPSSGRIMPWILYDEVGNEVDREFRSVIQIHEDVLGCVNLASVGGGIFQTYHFITESLVQRGELVEILKPYNGRSRRFSIIYPQNRHLSVRVRAFIDFVTAEVRRITGGSAGNT